MTKISDRLAELSSRNEHALIGYAVAGYPDRKSTIDVIRAMVNGGVDIVELGIPFSDPIADGPTIQKASYKALQRG
ncbi:MAG: tryptophan synthase subunit alpha, partial [Nitrososphaerales archaeon]